MCSLNQHSDFCDLLKHYFSAFKNLAMSESAPGIPVNTEGSPPVTRKRLWGIDVLRILCMLMIPELHVAGRTGIQKSAKFPGAKWFVVQALGALCLCSVNCFALISGYVSSGKTQVRYARLGTQWLQVFCYSAA